MNSTHSLLSLPGTFFRIAFLLLAFLPVVEGSQTLCRVAWGLILLAMAVAVITLIVQAKRHGKFFWEAMARGENLWTDIMDLGLCILGIVLCYHFGHQLLKFWEFMACFEVLNLVLKRKKAAGSA